MHYYSVVFSFRPLEAFICARLLEELVFNFTNIVVILDKQRNVLFINTSSSNTFYNLLAVLGKFELEGHKKIPFKRMKILAILFNGVAFNAEFFLKELLGNSEQFYTFFTDNSSVIKQLLVYPVLNCVDLSRVLDITQSLNTLSPVLEQHIQE